MLNADTRGQLVRCTVRSPNSENQQQNGMRRNERTKKSAWGWEIQRAPKLSAETPLNRRDWTPKRGFHHAADIRQLKASQMRLMRSRSLVALSASMTGPVVSGYKADGVCELASSV